MSYVDFVLCHNAKYQGFSLKNFLMQFLLHSACVFPLFYKIPRKKSMSLQLFLLAFTLISRYSATQWRLWAALFHNHILYGGDATPPCRAIVPGFFHSMTKEVNISMADEKKATGHEEQAPPAGPGGSKVPPAPQTKQQPVQSGIENLDFPSASRTLAQQTGAKKEIARAVKITVEFYSRLAYTMD